MITVGMTKLEIATESKKWNPATRQHETREGKMTKVGVKIDVETKYGTSYRWRCYLYKGAPGNWKREKCNSASKRDYYTEDEVLENLIAQAGLIGVDKMIEATTILAKLCGKK